MWKSKPAENDDRPDLSALNKRVDALLDENRRLLQNFEAMQAHFGGLARSVWRVQEDERRKLARELHDGVGQNLTALRHRLESIAPGEARDAAIELAGQILEDVRELSRLLRPPVLDDLGLAAALKWLCRRVRESAGLPLKVDVQALEELSLPDETETLVFRVVQESLHNCTRHADANRASLTATRAGNRIEVTFSDDGRGFDPATLAERTEESGIGLAGMRDRVKLFGGDLTINSRPGHGTRIVVGIPLAESSSPAGVPT